ncbi:MAG: hypothetical protein Q4C13_03805, partial [Clostridia bacterium]|nr:hypothetical protein [Clostridia bacterium]
RLMALALRGGCREDGTWSLCGEGEVQLLRDFRHAAQEAAHAAVDRARAAEPSLYAPGMDLRLPPDRCAACAAEARALGLSCACFGQLSEGRVRLSFMPEDMAALRRAEDFLRALRQGAGLGAAGFADAGAMADDALARGRRLEEGP